MATQTRKTKQGADGTSSDNSVTLSQKGQVRRHGDVRHVAIQKVPSNYSNKMPTHSYLNLDDEWRTKPNNKPLKNSLLPRQKKWFVIKYHTLYRQHYNDVGHINPFTSVATCAIKKHICTLITWLSGITPRYLKNGTRNQSKNNTFHRLRNKFANG